jgi:hypothetical protein
MIKFLRISMHLYLCDTFLCKLEKFLGFEIMEVSVIFMDQIQAPEETLRYHFTEFKIIIMK